MPQRISAASNVWTFWAVKNKAVQALISIRQTITVQR